MARIRAVKDQGGKTVVLWTPSKGGRPPAMATWEVTVSLGRDRAGRYRQRSVRLRGTLTQAKAKATELDATAGAGGEPEDQRRTLGEALAAYIEHAEVVLRRTGKTLTGYRSIARSVQAELGKLRLRQLSAADLDRYYLVLGERGASPTTIGHHHALISQALNMAVRRRWIAPPNPAQFARPPSIERRSPTAPTPAEAQLLISALAARPETADKAALLLLAGITGCRRGEICGWRWSDLDVESGALVVRRAISLAPAPTEQRTKTKRERRIAVTAGTLAVLATQWDRYVRMCRDAEVDPDPDSYIFSGALDHSTPLNPNSVTQAFGRLRGREARRLRENGDKKAAERLEKIELGHFRHFAATQMAGAGVDLRTASARMGHDGAVFFRHYAAVIDTHDQEAAALLEGLLLPALSAPAAAPDTP